MAFLRTSLARFFLLIPVALLLPWAGPDARAQPAGSTSLTIRLLRQPIWHRPGDPLGIKVRIKNVGSEDVQGFGIRLGAYERVTSRSALHDNFNEAPGQELSSVPKRYPRVTLAPGDSTSIVINDPVESLTTLQLATEGGVFPLTLTVYDLGTAAFLDYVTTPLIYYPARPETPLDLVTVVPLGDVPSEGPDGTFTTPSPAGVPLEDAASPGGWLQGVVGALDDLATLHPLPRPPATGRGKHRHRPPRPTPERPLHVGLAPTPRLLQEIGDLAAGYRRSDGSEVSHDSPHARGAAAILTELKHLLGRNGVQSLLVPYSYPDLPTLDQLSLPEMLEQLSEGRRVFQEELGRNVSAHWLFPPGGRLDEATLGQLQLAGSSARHIALVSSGSTLAPPEPDLAGCPDAPASFACPAAIQTSHGTSTGFLSDQGLEQRLAPLTLPGGNDRLTLQQFFAETAMIHAERPGIAGRVVEATIPSVWHPRPDLSRLLFRGIQEAPWLRSVTPAEGLEKPAKPVPREIVPTETPVATSLPPDFYENVLLPARAIVSSYSTVATEDTTRLKRLDQNLLVAESRLLWHDPVTAESFVERSQQEAQDEMSKIKIIGVNDVTLTSSRGKFQLVLANGTDTPVTVSIKLNAPQLSVDPELLDKLSTTYAPGNHPLTISATARVSGKFPLTVLVQSANGYPIAQKDIEIRSTAFNRIALGITIGALAFLILFYLVRAFRRRSRTTGEPEADAQ
jgi:hypothetical protein